MEHLPDLHREFREALTHLERLAATWLERKAGGLDPTAIEADLKGAESRSRGLERKIRRGER